VWSEPAAGLDGQADARRVANHAGFSSRGRGSPTAPETDLVGSWRQGRRQTIDLAITDGAFTWKAIQAGKPAAELKGQLTSTSDELVLTPTRVRWPLVVAGTPSGSCLEGAPSDQD
jgi:hypothetical protein